MKKVLAVLLALTAAVCTACGGSGKGSGKSDTKADEVDINTVFQAKAVDLGDILGSNSSVRSVVAADGNYSMVVTDWSKDNDGGTLVSFKEDGSDVQTAELPALEDNVSLTAADTDGNGNVYRILDSTQYDENGSYQSGKYVLQKLNSDGGQAWSTDLYTPSQNDDTYFYILSFLTSSPDGNLYISEEDKIAVFSADDGSKKKDCEVPENGGSGNLACDEKGDVVYCCSTDTGTGLYKLDADKGTSDEIEVSDDEALGYASVYSGTGSTVYTGSDKGVYSVDVSGGKAALYINYVASDLDVNDMTSLASLDGGHFCCIYNDNDGNYKVLILTKADPDVYNNKTILTLGCMYADSVIREYVIAFNQSSEKYRINLTTYSDSDDSDETYGSALNKAILSDDMPDMVLLNYGQDYTSYEKKGVFEPLDSYFGENGPSSDEYLTNIFDALRVDGEMYILPTSFDVRCLVGRQSDFGDTNTLTVQQLEDVAKKRNVKIEDCMGSYMTKDTFLQNAVNMTVKDYVDFESGKCSFDSDDFKSLLQFANQFRDDVPDNQDDADSGIRSGKQVVMDQAISSFNDYNLILSGYVGEATAFMGYPGTGKSGPAINIDTEIAMSASSKNKDACWDFMKSMIGESGTSAYDSSLPVNIKRLEKMGQEATQPQYYVDENGQKQIADETWSIGDQEITIEPLSQDEVNAMEELIKSLDTVTYYDSSDSSITSIISEEASAYFSGQKSVDDVAKTIQSRVNIYINENK